MFGRRYVRCAPRADIDCDRRDVSIVPISEMEEAARRSISAWSVVERKSPRLSSICLSMAMHDWHMARPIPRTESFVISKGRECENRPPSLAGAFGLFVIERVALCLFG